LDICRLLSDQPFFITYIVAIEQIIIPDSLYFQQPFWPPASMVKLIHWYGNSFDPLLMARPVWWKMNIWIDSLFYGPFYAFAIYAFIKGRSWIRIPALFFSGMMVTGVIVILEAEVAGPHATPNLPWLLVPLLLIARLWKEHPFSGKVGV
jgi:hypothetical protein